MWVQHPGMVLPCRIAAAALLSSPLQNTCLPSTCGFAVACSTFLAGMNHVKHKEQVCQKIVWPETSFMLSRRQSRTEPVLVATQVIIYHSRVGWQMTGLWRRLVLRHVLHQQLAAISK